jgi:predicted nucleic acid-binding protein
MGPLKYLMDTNAVIDYLGQKLPASGMAAMNTIVNAVPNISVVTKIELLGFNTIAGHEKLLVNFVNDSIVLDLITAIVDATIEIRKKHKIKLPDAIIAATALVHNLILISCNTEDFKGIQGLQVIDPHQM